MGQLKQSTIIQDFFIVVTLIHSSLSIICVVIALQSPNQRPWAPLCLVLYKYTEKDGSNPKELQALRKETIYNS